jgi:hypothetical protein
MASHTQEAIIEDDALLDNPATTASALQTMHDLGATRVRVAVLWSHAEPANGAYSLGTYDLIDRDAKAAGMSVYFMLTGPAPGWATGKGAPRGVHPGTWKPSASAFRAFAATLGKRYNGSTTPAGDSTPLPRVTFWSLWNEPNYNQEIMPQTTDHDRIDSGAAIYRGLLDAGWSGLTSTGHKPGKDTILFGETAPRGGNSPSQGLKPLRFLRSLYCVDSRRHVLTGSAAKNLGCPTTSSGRRGFRRAHPALFAASGFAAHLYALQANPGPPNKPSNANGGPKSDPDYADLPQMPALVSTLDALNRTWGSHSRFPVYNTEYGYRTHPPDKVGVSQSTAAYYINWAEYISYRNSRLRDDMQYLLRDPLNGIFASGLVLPSGRAKPAYDAYRMPLFLPSTSARRGHTLEVWGGARPAHTAAGSQRVSIEFRSGSHGTWKVLEYVTIHNSRGYIDIRVKFPTSGAVRLGWRAPDRHVDYSRTQSISVR